MICYKDMTFCVALCATTNCPRNRVNIPAEEEIELPIAVSDFSDKCDIYIPREEH